MDGQEARIDALERRIRSLELRLELLDPASAGDRASSAVQTPGAQAPGREPASAIPSPTAPPPSPPAIAVAVPAIAAAGPPLAPAGPPAPPLNAVPPAWGRPPERRGPAPATALAWQAPGDRSAAQPASRAAAPPASGAAAPPRRSISLRDLEERFAGRALAWVGGLALVAAAIFFLSLAFSRGWIDPPMRVLIGLGVGVAALVLGAVLLGRRNRLMGNVLSAVGLGIVSISLFAATRLYGLVPPEAGLAGALVTAVVAVAIAVRFDAREVAAFGLVSALVAPPVVGASATPLTLAFIAVTLVGTTAIALFRSWRWLPPIAFVLVAPQLADWLQGGPETGQALAVLAGFWLVNIVAAAGEEIRIWRDDLRPSSATLVLANVTFLLWGGFTVLDGDLARWQGTFVAAAAVAHLGLGAWFLARRGMGHLFGNLVAGTGVALVAIAAFVQLGAAAVPLAWAAEAVALAWLAVRRRHRWSAAAAVVLLVAVVTHLVTLEYPLRDAGIPAETLASPAFLNPAFGSLAAVVAALAIAIVAVPIAWVRSGLAGLAVVLAAYGLTFEVRGPALAAGLVAAALVGLAFDRVVVRFRTDDGLRPVTGWVSGAWLASVGATLAGGMAIALLFSTEFPPSALADPPLTGFLRPASASLAIVLAGLVGAVALVGVRWVRSALAATGVLLMAWAAAFEVSGPTLVGVQAVLLPVGVILDRALRTLPAEARFRPLARAVRFRAFATVAGTVSWAAAAALGVASYLSPLRWGLDAPPAVPFTDDRTLVAALLAGAALAAGRWLGPGAARRSTVVAAIAVFALVVPYEVTADLVVVLWISLAGIAALAARLDHDDLVVFDAVAGGLVAGAAVVAFGIVAPPYRLWVADPAAEARAALLPGWPLAFLALAVAFVWAARRGSATRRTALAVAAGATVVYLLSVAVVDLFARQVGGPIAVEELAKQAQVALSVCWTAIGALALVAGLVRRAPMLRHAGFALLALATAKVFLIDLAAMDVAYRALVLAGLGLLLLGSAFLVTRFRGPRAGMPEVTGGPPADA